MQAKITVEARGEEPKHFVIRPGQRFDVGRSEASLVLSDDSVSRRHARIELRPDGEVWVADLNSRNGTFLADKRLEPYRPARVGPEIPVFVGCYRLRVELVVDELTRPHKLGELERAAAYLPERELELLSVLGRGANGVVYAAYQKLMDRRVAVKCISGVTEDEEAVRRFLQEGRLACRVRSPNVVEVYDIRHYAGRVFMVMELVEGMSLQDHCRTSGRLGVPEALLIGEQVANGLAAVHLEGVVHRDIKPSNILLGPRGVAKLGDFGVAKELARPGETPAGRARGTLAFVSPEQAMADPDVDERTDVYSLGATLYYVIAGTPPQEPTDKLLEMFERPAPPLRTHSPTCPAAVERFVASMLKRNPDKRPLGATQVLAELRALREDIYPNFSPPEQIDLTQTQRRKKGWPAGGTQPPSSGSWPGI